MTASTLTNLQTSSATQRQALPSTRRTRSARSARQPSVSRVPVHAQANRNGIQRDSQATPSYAAMKLLSAMAAAQLALSGAAVAGINDPVLPGAKVTSKDLPDGPKPLDALKGSGGGDIGKAISSASDKAGEKTPDVNVPGFGPFKFNPKEDAKQAAKKSPLGFLRAAGMTNAPSLTIQANKMLLADLPSLPGSNVSKDDLPDGPKLPTSGNPGAEARQAASALGKASDKAGENTPDVNVPGFGPFKFNPKEDAKQAAKKSPLGFMQGGEMAKFNEVQKRRRAQKAEKKRSVHGDPTTGKLHNKPQPLSISGKRKRKLLKKWRRDQNEAVKKGLITMQDVEMAAADADEVEESRDTKTSSSKFPMKKKSLKIKQLKGKGKKKGKSPKAAAAATPEASVDAMLE